MPICDAPAGQLYIARPTGSEQRTRRTHAQLRIVSLGAGQSQTEGTLAACTRGAWRPGRPGGPPRRPSRPLGPHECLIY